MAEKEKAILSLFGKKKEDNSLWGRLGKSIRNKDHHS